MCRRGAPGPGWIGSGDTYGTAAKVGAASTPVALLMPLLVRPWGADGCRGLGALLPSAFEL